MPLQMTATTIATATKTTKATKISKAKKLSSIKKSVENNILVNSIPDNWDDVEESDIFCRILSNCGGRDGGSGGLYIYNLPAPPPRLQQRPKTL